MPSQERPENLDAFGQVKLDVVRARARAMLDHRCRCGLQAQLGKVCRVGTRSWIPCDRCLGIIRQLS